MFRPTCPTSGNGCMTRTATLELEVVLRPTVSRPVSLGIGPPFGTLDQILSCSSFFWQLRRSAFNASSLTRKRICNLLYNCFWALPEQSHLSRSPTEVTAIFYCLLWDSLNLEGQVPVFISPRNRVVQLYPRALGSLSVASYDSQGYGGSILTRLHTGCHSVFLEFKYISMQSITWLTRGTNVVRYVLFALPFLRWVCVFCNVYASLSLIVIDSTTPELWQLLSALCGPVFVYVMFSPLLSAICKDIINVCFVMFMFVHVISLFLLSCPIYLRSTAVVDKWMSLVLRL
jgi:hypothetical protein